MSPAPSNEPKIHFVAHLKIEKVEKEPRSMSGDRGKTPPRVIDEVTHLTIKADTLEALTEKLGKHIAIIEED